MFALDDAVYCDSIVNVVSESEELDLVATRQSGSPMQKKAQPPFGFPALSGSLILLPIVRLYDSFLGEIVTNPAALQGYSMVICTLASDQFLTDAVQKPAVALAGNAYCKWGSKWQVKRTALDRRAQTPWLPQPFSCGSRTWRVE